MAYLTLDDLVRRFGRGEILDIARDPLDEDDETIDQQRIDDAIADAEGEIDSSLAAGGYALPLARVPQIVTGYGCDIARYRLYDDRATDQVTRRYDDAIRFLRAVASGALKLGVPAVDDAASSGEAMFAPRPPRRFPGGAF